MRRLHRQVLISEILHTCILIVTRADGSADTSVGVTSHSARSQFSRGLSSAGADALLAADLPAPVWLPPETPHLEALQEALWSRGVPTDRGTPLIPPPDRRTFLLSGDVSHITDVYTQLANITGVTSARISWLLVTALADDDVTGGEVARAELEALLREGERSLVVVCGGDNADGGASCRSYAATSRGSGSVSLEPWSADSGLPAPDWRLLTLGGRELTLLVPSSKKRNYKPCTSPIINAWYTANNETRLCGYLGETLTVIAERINCTYRAVRKGGCGFLQADGTYSGRPGWLRAGKGDIGASSCTRDEQRASAVYMGEWFWSGSTAIGTGQPAHAHDEFLVFLVMTKPVWIALGVYTVLYALILWVVEWAALAVSKRDSKRTPHRRKLLLPADNSFGDRIAPRIASNFTSTIHSYGRDVKSSMYPLERSFNASTYRHERRVRSGTHHVVERTRVPPLVDYLQQSVRMWLGVGDDVTSSFASSRIIMVFVYMSTITVMSVYAGNLTAFFSLPRLEPAVESLQDLARSHMEPHVTFGQSHYYLFANASGGARGQIWRRMSACGGCVHRSYRTTESREFVASMVRGERSLFQSERSILRRADNHLAWTGRPAAAQCPLRVARSRVRGDFSTLQLPHHGKYNALFDDGIRWLRYYGVIEHIFGRWAKHKCSVSAPVEHHAPALSMHVLQGAFLVWATGLAAALALLLAECLCSWCGRCNQLQQHTAHGSEAARAGRDAMDLSLRPAQLAGMDRWDRPVAVTPYSSGRR